VRIGGDQGTAGTKSDTSKLRPLLYSKERKKKDMFGPCICLEGRKDKAQKMLAKAGAKHEPGEESLRPAISLSCTKEVVGKEEKELKREKKSTNPASYCVNQLIRNNKSKREKPNKNLNHLRRKGEEKRGKKILLRLRSAISDSRKETEKKKKAMNLAQGPNTPEGDFKGAEK